MNSTLVHIMKKLCPLCSSEARRDVHIPHFGQGQNFIVWTCTNGECEKSKHWFKGNKIIKDVQIPPSRFMKSPCAGGSVWDKKEIE